jgi:hypothetical protein
VTKQQLFLPPVGFFGKRANLFLLAVKVAVSIVTKKLFMETKTCHECTRNYCIALFQKMQPLLRNMMERITPVGTTATWQCKRKRSKQKTVGESLQNRSFLLPDSPTPTDDSVSVPHNAVIRAAEHKLNTWLQEIEKVKSGILTQDEFEISKRISDKIEDQIPLFKEYLKDKYVTKYYIKSTISKITKICKCCSFKLMS